MRDNRAFICDCWRCYERASHHIKIEDMVTFQQEEFDICEKDLRRMMNMSNLVKRVCPS